MTKFIAHFCIITGSHSKVDDDAIREIFDKIDNNHDGKLDIDEYKKALEGNPGLFQWFDLLNQGGQNDGKRAKKTMIDFK